MNSSNFEMGHESETKDYKRGWSSRNERKQVEKSSNYRSGGFAGWVRHHRHDHSYDNHRLLTHGVVDWVRHHVWTWAACSACFVLGHLSTWAYMESGSNPTLKEIRQMNAEVEASINKIREVRNEF